MNNDIMNIALDNLFFLNMSKFLVTKTRKCSFSSVEREHGTAQKHYITTLHFLGLRAVSNEL